MNAYKKARLGFLLIVVLFVFLHIACSVMSKTDPQENIIAYMQANAEASETVYVKYVNETVTYYRYTLTDGLTEILSAFEWEPTEETDMTAPYLVFRLAEGYELALDSDGLAAVYDYYGDESLLTKGQWTYFRTGNTERVMELILTDGIECTKEDLPGMFVFRDS